MSPGVTYTERTAAGTSYTPGTPAPGAAMCRVHFGVGVFCQPRFIMAVSTYTERTCISTSFTERAAVSTTYTERSV